MAIDYITLIKDIFDFITPYVEILIIFITPIYISIGQVFGAGTVWFLDLVPYDNLTLPMIIGGVIIVIAIVLTVLAEKKKDD